MLQAMHIILIRPISFNDVTNDVCESALSECITKKPQERKYRL